MAISQFDKPAELPKVDFDFLLKARELGEAKKTNNLKILGEATKDLPIEGGYATQNLAQKYNQTVINPLLQKYTEKVANNEPLTSWYPQFMSDARKISSDPVYNAIKADKEYQQNVDPQLKDPVFKYSIQDYYNPQKGFAQIDEANIYAGWNPATHYEITKPKSVNEDFKDLYSQIKPKIEQKFGAPVESFTYDTEGNPIALLRTTEGYKEQKLDRNTVREVIAPYVYSDFNNLLGSKESLRYNAKYFNRQNPNFVYTPESAIEDITQGFLGEMNDRTELPPKIQQQMIPKAKTTGQGTTKNITGYDNEVERALTELGTLDSQGNLAKGSTAARIEVVAPMIGGTVKEGKAVINFDPNHPAFLQVPKTVTGAKEEDFTLAKALPYVSSYNNYKDKLKETFEDIQLNQVRKINGVDKEGNEVKYTLLDDGSIGVKDVSINNPTVNWDHKITFDDFIYNYLPSTELINSPIGFSINNIAKVTSENLGINISDPAVQSKIINFNKNPKAQAFQDVAMAVSNLAGNYQFYTDPSQDNLYLDDSGNVLGKGFIILSEAELAQVMPDNYNKAIEQGIILPAGFVKGENDQGKTVQMRSFRVPIYKPTAGTVENVTRGYVNAAYGNREDIDKAIPGFIEGTKQAHDNLSSKRGFVSFSKAFDSDKSEEPMFEDLAKQAAPLENIGNGDDYYNALSAIRELYNNYADKKITKTFLKKQLYLIYKGIQTKISQNGDTTLNTPEYQEFIKAQNIFGK